MFCKGSSRTGRVRQVLPARAQKKSVPLKQEERWVRLAKIMKAIATELALVLVGCLVLLCPGGAFGAGAETASEGSFFAVVGVGDVLELTVWNEPGLAAKSQVGEDGIVVFPLIGPVHAAGLSVSGLKEAVEKQYADGYLVDPQVSITVVQRTSHNVFVLGAVRSPGVYPLQERTTLLELFARCGGATDNASETIVIMRHAGGEEGPHALNPEPTERIEVNRSGLLSGELEENIVLRSRDIVLFPSSRKLSGEVYVLGDVDKKGPYALSENMPLVRLLASVGLSPSNEKCTVTLSRFESGRLRGRTFCARDVFQGKVGMDVSLKDGDILTVEQVTEIYYVIGQVQAPGAFRLRQGLTVREAIIMAGWKTSRGNLRKIKVTRSDGEEWKTQSVELTDLVQPGDVIHVEERWF